MKNITISLITFTFGVISLVLSCQSSDSNKVNPSTPASYDAKVLPDSVYLRMGKEYALGAQTVLGKNLTEAIQKKGTTYAVDFCNTRAYPLTDSMSKKFNVLLKRVTDKERNRANRANESELEILSAMKKNIDEGKSPEPQLVRNIGKVTAYYAITTTALCLQCHGNKDKDINTETFNKIRTLYPSDNAIGYGINQLRGIWAVQMEVRTN